MGPAFNDRSKIYALQLDEEADFPFRAKTELDLSADEKDFSSVEKYEYRNMIKSLREALQVVICH